MENKRQLLDILFTAHLDALKNAEGRLAEFYANTERGSYGFAAGEKGLQEYVRHVRETAKRYKDAVPAPYGNGARIQPTNIVTVRAVSKKGSEKRYFIPFEVWVDTHLLISRYKFPLQLGDAKTLVGLTVGDSYSVWEGKSGDQGKETYRIVDVI